MHNHVQIYQKEPVGTISKLGLLLFRHSYFFYKNKGENSFSWLNVTGLDGSLLG